jgi:hypothetical protein
MSVYRVTTVARFTLAAYLIFLMMMHPSIVICLQVGLDGGFVAGRMAFDFAAGADALVRLDMGAGGHLLQEDFDCLRAVGALESEDTGWFQHKRKGK